MAALTAACVALGITSSPGDALAAYSFLEPPNGYGANQPMPPALFGLWALGHKCDVRSARLRITANTLAVANKPPVEYDDTPESPHHLESSLGPKDPTDISEIYTYDTQTHLLIPDVAGWDPDQIYFPCFGHTPGWPPHPLENRDATFDRLVARLIHAPLSEAQFESLWRVYFIKGEAAFRSLARLLNAGRRAEVHARLQRFEQEIAVYPSLEHAGAAGLAPPLPTPDFGHDHPLRRAFAK